MNTVTRAQFVAEARTWLGTPYRHQGRLKGVAVDCIGLALCVARDVGISDFEFSGYQKRPDGTLKSHMDSKVEPVSFALAQPADLILFQFNNCPMHVGILSENWQVIHAYAPNRKVVEHRIDERLFSMVTGAYHIPGVV